MRSYFIILIFLVVGTYACKKTPKIPESNKMVVPIVVTTNIFDITTISAYAGGHIINNGGGSVIACGLCWDTMATPSLEKNIGYSDEDSHTTHFQSNITNLLPGENYFVVAYATNEMGTGYGEIKTFQTVSITLPTVTTSGISQLTITSAVSGGEVTDNGNSTITARGICWDIQANPSIINNEGFSDEGTGLGVFESNLTGLTDGTNYYYTAYSTNEKGTSYGEIRTFSTPVDYCDGIITVNYGGQIYHTVSIGEQCWMKENLNYETGNSWCYEDDPANCANYGRLYDWATVMNGESSSNLVPSGVQGICPDGWHVPSDEEWKILEGTVDTQYGVGNSIWDGDGWRGFNVGQRLKTVTGWTQNSGTDAHGFSALPSGYRNNYGYFNGIGNYAYFWSSSESDYNIAWRRILRYASDGASRSSNDKDYGVSLRCLKD